VNTKVRKLEPLTAPARLDTPTDLSAEGVREISAALNALIADTFALYVKTKNFHWHVSGPHFRDYHLLLDEQGDQLVASIDILPALTRALKLQAQAGEVGFDWNDPLAVLAKIREEANEIETELAAGNRATAGAEVGDLLFAVVNLARHLDVDPEATLRATNQKFERRFAAIERALAERGKTPQAATLEEMDELWNEAKAAERAPRSRASR